MSGIPRPRAAAYSFVTARQLGDQVEIGRSITATIEEVIWARNMVAPFYLVEWWQDGQLVSRRVHEEDCR